jgi:uncharacterized protein YecA (UPF0149 family)
VEYKIEARKMFNSFTSVLENTIIQMILRVHISQERERINLTQNKNFQPQNKIGRNDPCPCGSGKKYKKCHGK